MRPFLVPAVAILALALLAAPASAACVLRACVAVADGDGDSVPEAAQATVMGNGAYAQPGATESETSVFALGYRSDTTHRYEPEAESDGSPGQRAKVETVNTLPGSGAFVLLYAEDFGEGDTVDYVYGTATVWTPVAVAVGGLVYHDDAQDGKPGYWRPSVN